MAWSSAHCDHGALLSYTALNPEVVRIAAGQVKRILVGERPADIPGQLPTKFELVLNMKTVKALGLTISPQFLGRVDRLLD